LRAMKSERNKYILRSIVCIGTPALLALEESPLVPEQVNTSLRSPFNASDTIHYPFLT